MHYMPKAEKPAHSKGGEEKLNGVLKDLWKKFGDGAVRELGDDKRMDITAIPSGSFSIDYVFGCGGLPRGRIIEIYGAESSGKSTLAMYLVGQAQKQGHRAFWLDAECSFSKKYAANIGVDTEKLLIAQPTSGEEGLTMLSSLVGSGEIGIAVVDSVASLVPERELSGEITDAEMAQQARMMSKALRMFTGAIAKSQTVVIFINQTREKVGVFYGKKDTTPGGKALKFYASVRLEVRRSESLYNEHKDVIGNVMSITATKNKVGMPFRHTEVDLYYEKGIDTVADIFEAAITKSVIKRSGNSYTFLDKLLGVGRAAAIEAIKKEDGLYKQIFEQLIAYDTDQKNNQDGEPGPAE